MANFVAASSRKGWMPIRGLCPFAVIMKKKLLYLLAVVLWMLPTSSQELIVHPWKGKRVAYFGDSITDPKQGGGIKKYWNFLQEWLGITPYVYAVSGRQWNDIPRQAEQLRKEHAADFDAILVFIGTNDYNAGIPLGEWHEIKADSVRVFLGDDGTERYEIRRHKVPVMTDGTYKGRINIALSTLKKMYPDKQIVLLTPIHRSVFRNGNGNMQQPEDFVNKVGEDFQSYVDCVRQAGRLWAMPVIDMGSACGIFPLYDEHAAYFGDAEKDRLHPNVDGHRRMAKTLMYQLLALPCDF